MCSVTQIVRFVSRLSLFIPAILALFLNGCGGGSGGGSGNSQYTVGGTVSGLGASGLVLQNNNGDDLSVTGSSFEFDTALDDGSGYAVTVSAQPTGQVCTVTNGSGTVAGADVTDVVVACKSWGSAETIDNDTGGASFPQVAFDHNGNAIAVWQQNDGSYVSIYANYYTYGSGWGTAELIESGNAGNAYSPQIAFDGGGDATAVWRQDDGSGIYSIYANRYTSGGGWGTAELIENDDTGSAETPQIAFDADGNALTVWSQYDGSYYSIYANRYTPVSGWGTAELIESSDTGNANKPQIAFDADGNALAVWELGDGGVFPVFSIYANRYTSGSGWGTAELIEGEAGDTDSPQIAFDADGNALAVWYQINGSYYSIYANRYTSGSGWGTAELIESDDTNNASYPQVAFDTAGNALAVWEQSDGSYVNIYANRYTSGGGWGMAELVESSDTGDANRPQIAFDASGNALTVWAQDDGSTHNIWSNHYTPGSGWGTAELIEGGAGSAEYPKIAIDADGNALAVWHQNDGSDNSIYANRYE